MIRFFCLATFLMFGCIAAADSPSPLKTTPSEALSKLGTLDGRNPPITKDEAGLIEDAEDGKFDRYSFSEACLIAGGVHDPKTRKKYLDRLDDMETEARKATAGSKSVAEDAARLLAFLHAGPMAGGYKAEQTDLHVLLDTKVFNCVSSAALYTVMGQRLGIDVRAIEVPQHVFSVLVTKDRKIDVETNAALGFDMDPNRSHGPANAKRPTNKRREVAPIGLAAVVAFNHGVTLFQKKSYIDSARANLLALGLDSRNESAKKNLIVNLNVWSIELTANRRLEKAMAVVSVGREMVPSETGLREITLVLCDAWAKEYIAKEDWTGAVQVYGRGLREFPGDDHLTNNEAYCRRRLR